LLTFASPELRLREVIRSRKSMSAMDQVREFVKDVQLESAKVSWPTRGELRDSTVVVIVTVLLVAAFVGVVDGGLNTVVRAIFR